MKEIMVIIDGAISDDYKTCENINYLKDIGEFTVGNNTPIGLETNSLTCIMTMLGVNKEYIPRGRAYLEALSIGENIGKEDLIFRCNNVEISDEKLISSCNTSSIEKIELKNKNVKLINMGSYKNLLIVRNKAHCINSIVTYPPHENMGRRLDEIMPESNDKELDKLLKEIICEYNLYPWSPSVKVNIPSFKKLHNKSGAIVCKTEIVKGIGKALNMYCPSVKDTTADIDTDLMAKGRKTLELINDYDFVLLHINGADESAHRRNNREKLQFIERIDKELIKYLIDNLKNGIRLIVTSDHGTSAVSGKHVNGEVNRYIVEKGGRGYGKEYYDTGYSI